MDWHPLSIHSIAPIHQYMDVHAPPTYLSPPSTNSPQSISCVPRMSDAPALPPLSPPLCRYTGGATEAMLQLGDHDQLLAFAQQALEDAAQAAQLLEKRVREHAKERGL